MIVGYASRYDPAGVITRLGPGKPAGVKTDDNPVGVNSDDNPVGVKSDDNPTGVKSIITRQRIINQHQS